MRIFVLGTTGWIGGAITDALLASHHHVIGLARTENAVTTLKAKGVTALQGNMNDAEILLSVAHNADAVVVASASLDATVTALQTLITALQGTQKPLVYISGSSLYGDIGSREQVEEEIFIQYLAELSLRHSPEYIVYQAQEQDVHGLIIVGAGILYGRGGGATPTFLLDDAYQRNAACYIATGTQRWSAVHVEDMAQLIVHALEQKSSQHVFNAVTEALSLHDVAEMIAEATKVRGGAQSISENVAKDMWGGFWARSLAGNLWLSSKCAEETLGWKASAPSFRDDLFHGSYQAKGN